MSCAIRSLPTRSGLGVIPRRYPAYADWPDRPAESGTASVTPTRRSCSPGRPRCLRPTRPTPTMRSAASFRRSRIWVSSTIPLSSSLQGDNGTSPEGTTHRHPEFNDTAYIGILRASRSLNSSNTTTLGVPIRHYPHMAVAMVLGVSTPIQVDQAGRLALSAERGRAWRSLGPPGSRMRAAFRQPVPPCHRYRADDPRSHGIRAPEAWWTASSKKPMRRREHGCTPSRRRTQHVAVHANDAIFRDAGQPRESITTAGWPTRRRRMPPLDDGCAKMPTSSVG